MAQDSLQMNTELCQKHRVFCQELVMWYVIRDASVPCFYLQPQELSGPLHKLIDMCLKESRRIFQKTSFFVASKLLVSADSWM